MGYLKDIVYNIAELLSSGVSISDIADQLRVPMDWVQSIAEQEFMSEYSDFTRVIEDKDQ